MRLASPMLEAWFNRYQPGAKHQLGGTMIEAIPGERLASLLPDGWSPGMLELGYSGTVGSRALREALCASYGLMPDHVFLTAGATEANAAVLHALLEPGTNLVLQDPLYYQFAGLAEAMGIEVRRWTLPADPTVSPDLPALRVLLDERTRLVVLNTPHNPTGRVLDTRILQAIARSVEALPDAYLLVDAIYDGLSHAPSPSIVTLTSRGIAVDAVSKRWSMPGLRLGWVACADARLTARILPWHEHLTCSVSRVSEQLLEWLWPRREALFEEHRTLAARNRDLFSRWIPRLAEHAHVVLPPTGVMTLLWPEASGDDEALARRLREDHDCFVVPGSCLGYPGSLRIGFGHRDPVLLEEALSNLALGLASTRMVPA